MARRRLFTELGRGVDLQGRDHTKAAVRALKDALHRNSLTVAPALGYPREAMEVEILIGSARPDEIDADAVAAVLPYGSPSVRVVRGGLEVPADEGDGATVIAGAAAVVWLDVDEAEGAEGPGDDADGGPESRFPAGAPRDLAAEDRAQDAAREASDAETAGRAAPAAAGPGTPPPAPPGTTWRRIVLETGMGADLRGEDATKAARRAVHDALHSSSIALFRSLGVDPDSMAVEIRVGVQDPDAVDPGAVAAEAPHGRAVVVVERGGLDVPHPELGTRIVTATAAVIARLALPPGRFATGS